MRPASCITDAQSLFPKAPAGLHGLQGYHLRGALETHSVPSSSTTKVRLAATSDDM